MPKQGHRKLAAIMFTDIVGYSSIMEDDEDRGRLVRERHKSVFEQCIGRYQGRIIQYFGDGTLSVFDSAVSAVECAVCMQKQLKTYPVVPLRIGIHLGDIHYSETEIYGHGVNVAARIEPVCNPGGIFLSDKVYDEIRNHQWLKAKSLGLYSFKNIDHEVELFAVQDKNVAFPTPAEQELISDLSQRINLSTAAERSKAIRLYEKRLKSQRRKRIGRVSAISLVALLVLFAAIGQFTNVFSTVPKLEEGEVAIAVMPFTNIGGSEENEYFSDGMTEDILTLLSKIDGISVRSRTSVMQYKDTPKEAPQIARELGVNTILEGSVQRQGEKVRINAQLIDAVNDHHLWAHIYDAELTDIFDVQSQVAGDIAKQLKQHLSPKDRELLDYKPAKNATAYDYYLKGRQKYRKYTEEDNEKAIEYFYRALEVDSNYAYALAGLGDAYAQKAFHHGMSEEILDTAVLMGARAIDADPELSEGYKALGLAFHYKGDIEDAKRQYERAIELDPNNDMAANNLGTIERSQGNMKEAARWAARTMQINRSIPSSVINLADLYLELGDDESAERLIDQGLNIDPNTYELLLMKSNVRLREGNTSDARRYVERAIALKPDAPSGYELLGEIDMIEENWEEAETWFATALDKSTSADQIKVITLKALRTMSETRTQDSPDSEQVWAEIHNDLEKVDRKAAHKYGKMISVIEAGVNAELGHHEEALKSLKNATESGWLDHKSLEIHPVFDKLRQDPGFRQIMRQVEVRADSVLTEVKKTVTTDS